MQKIYEFLTGLRDNNNKEWFDKNRKLYEECRDKVLLYTELFNAEIHKFDNNIPLMNPKDCVFRIFRDIRFSKDKTPYKVNMGSFIAKGGRKSMRAGYYFHIQPGMSFVGGGIYMPPAEPLKAIRTEIYESPEEFVGIVNDKKFKKYFPEFYDHKLKTAPKGFPKDFEYIDYLRYKSYAFGSQIDDELLLSDNFVPHTVKAFKELAKLNAYLNRALDKNL